MSWIKKIGIRGKGSTRKIKLWNFLFLSATGLGYRVRSSGRVFGSGRVEFGFWRPDENPNLNLILFDSVFILPLLFLSFFFFYFFVLIVFTKGQTEKKMSCLKNENEVFFQFWRKLYMISWESEEEKTNTLLKKRKYDGTQVSFCFLSSQRVYFFVFTEKMVQKKKKKKKTEASIRKKRKEQAPKKLRFCHLLNKFKSSVVFFEANQFWDKRKIVLVSIHGNSCFFFVAFVLPKLTMFVFNNKTKIIFLSEPFFLENEETKRQKNFLFVAKATFGDFVLKEKSKCWASVVVCKLFKET